MTATIIMPVLVLLFAALAAVLRWALSRHPLREPWPKVERYPVERRGDTMRSASGTPLIRPSGRRRGAIQRDALRARIEELESELADVRSRIADAHGYRGRNSK